MIVKLLFIYLNELELSLLFLLNILYGKGSQL